MAGVNFFGGCKATARRHGGLLVLAVLLFGGSALAAERVHGQRLFLPVYSELPYGDRGAILKFRVMVDLRNVDSKSPVSLRRIDFMDARGRVVRSFLKEPLVLAPFVSEHFDVLESDRSGGISSGFLIEWQSAEPALPPVIQGVMLVGAYNQGVGLLSDPRILETQP